MLQHRNIIEEQGKAPLTNPGSYLQDSLYEFLGKNTHLKSESTCQLATVVRDFLYLTLLAILKITASFQ